MNVTARALAITTGHPALKLILLTVAASPGWPTAADVTRTSETDGSLAADALRELTRLRLVVEHPGPPARYAVAEDGWTYARTDTVGNPADTPADESLARLESGDITGIPLGVYHPEAGR